MSIKIRIQVWNEKCQSRNPFFLYPFLFYILNPSTLHHKLTKAPLCKNGRLNWLSPTSFILKRCCCFWNSCEDYDVKWDFWISGTCTADGTLHYSWWILYILLWWYKISLGMVDVKCLIIYQSKCLYTLVRCSRHVSLSDYFANGASLKVVV